MLFLGTSLEGIDNGRTDSLTFDISEIGSTHSVLQQKQSTSLQG